MTKDPAMKVSTVSILVNIVLSLFKLIAGIVGRSGAMISDAVHSASDVFSTIVVIVGLKVSGRKSDSGHQYGHERLECIASIILAVVLLVTGLVIGVQGVQTILSGNYDQIAVPGKISLVAAVISIAVKEWMYHYTKHTAKKIRSTALMADAWHHRTDSLSSIGSFIGIGGAMLGLRVLEPVAQVVIALFIVKAAVDIFNDSMNQMVDKACDEETVQQIRRIIEGCTGVIGIDDLKTRMFGSKIYVDVEIGADGSLTLWQSHAIAQQVHDQIEEHFGRVKHCMVHVNPKQI